MAETDQRSIVAALLDASRYPHPAKSVRLFETHVSWVLLAGRYAYKIKKAVHPGFLDFRKLEDRKYYCEEEIRLNKRLAPRIYLDVVSIGGDYGNPAIGKTPAIEYAVRMRRFDSSKTLDRLVDSGKLSPLHVDMLAKRIAAFHQGLSPAGIDSGFGSGLIGVANASFRELEKHWSGDLSPIKRAFESEHRRRLKCFRERLEQGHVKECHGDLHLGNIALVGNEPVPFDGIEFDEALRWIDVANEIAFPVMDLLFRNRHDLAWRLLNAYLEITGDYEGMQVFRFYLACRALVRAMVDAMRNRKESAGRHLELSAESLSPLPPFLIVTHGLPGSGKTTFSQQALELLGAIRLRSDLERKRMAGLKPGEPSNSAIDSGIYAGNFSRAVYSRLLDLARMLLSSGFPVIVDAAFLERSERERFWALARELSVPFAIAALGASRQTLQARILSRKGDASEAGIAVLEAKEQSAEPLDGEELLHAAHFSETLREWGKLLSIIGKRAPFSLPC